MKLALTVMLAISLLAAPAASGAGDPNAAKITVLQKQVKTLQKQVKTLTARIANTEDQLDANFAGDTCLGAQTTDLIQSTWGVIDVIAQALQSRTYFGAQTAVDDYQNCSSLQTPDVPRQGIVPAPKISFFQVLLQWLHVPV
jgi:hypothetical protein